MLTPDEEIVFRKKKGEKTELEKISCPVIDCNVQTRTKQQMLSHYRVANRRDADFKAPCFECEKQFWTESALRKHLSRHHVLFFNNEVAAVIPALEVPRPQSVNSDLQFECSSHTSANSLIEDLYNPNNQQLGTYLSS
ncbi:hypothetical protein OUZ56_012385 [Daphnia magna]|uniref:C2H2-type domain-containing protein n=1 Tax=Daphnia magna TaxID=35525 RepID=A0ABQ9Z443_9CRUS|nr:hypothetical protein OUZ56_012385 [Daphnia magna]